MLALVIHIQYNNFTAKKVSVLFPEDEVMTSYSQLHEGPKSSRGLSNFSELVDFNKSALVLSGMAAMKTMAKVNVKEITIACFIFRNFSCCLEMKC